MLYQIHNAAKGSKAGLAPIRSGVYNTRRATIHTTTLRAKPKSRYSGAGGSQTKNEASQQQTLDWKMPVAGLAGSLTAALIGYIYYQIRFKPVQNDSFPEATKHILQNLDWNEEHLQAIAWGSNRYLLTQLWRWFN